MEEACRQLLKRLKKAGAGGASGDEWRLLPDKEAVLGRVRSSGLFSFTDAYLDHVIQNAANHSDPIIAKLAACLINRRPPRLIKEVSGVGQSDSVEGLKSFRRDCRHLLPKLAERHNIPLGHFLIANAKPIKIEERGSLLTHAQARSLGPEERDELIKVFRPGEEEPVSIVDLEGSLASVLANHPYSIARLYVVWDGDETLIDTLKREVAEWFSF